MVLIVDGISSRDSASDFGKSFILEAGTLR